MDNVKFNDINNAVADFFLKNKSVSKVSAKELMPFFIQRGVFTSDHKDGLPIRKLLRELDKRKDLNLIPSAFAERKTKNTNWFFVRTDPIKNTPIKFTDAKQVAVKKIYTGRKTSMLPIADNESRIVILGSLPGAISLEKGQYYANKNNHFWIIMNAVYGELPKDYEAKCNWLLQKGIALWDVISHAEREGSLDSAIKDEQANDFSSFFEKHPKISVVYFNGTKAQQVYRNLVNIKNDKTFVLLPSSSSARAMRKEDKIKEWRQSLTKILK